MKFLTATFPQNPFLIITFSSEGFPLKRTLQIDSNKSAPNECFWGIPNRPFWALVFKAIFEMETLVRLKVGGSAIAKYYK